jgi:hypothetical protein
MLLTCNYVVSYLNVPYRFVGRLHLIGQMCPLKKINQGELLLCCNESPGDALV